MCCTLYCKRVYDEPEKTDGLRVLVDRLWPRGLSREKAAVDVWCRELAPSDELRKAFHHGRIDWPEFERRYRDELQKRPGAIADAVRELRGKLPNQAGPASSPVVTLLYGSRDTEQNQAVVLRTILNALL